MRVWGRFGSFGLQSLGASSLAAMALALASTPAAAAQQVRKFDIAGTELASALNAYARQANQQIIFSSEQVAGKRSPGVRGEMAPGVALQTLLNGSGLRAEGDGIITLRAVGSARTAARPIAYRDDADQAAAPAQPATSPAATTTVADAGDEAEPVEMVVTGSRIVRDGSSAPVPTTVVTADDIAQRNPINIADYINQLPSIGQGQSPRATTQFVNANGGANQINARGLGINRTLVLLDGRRVVGSGLLPAVDINLLPQNLVKRVDVVTGGASAAYGSDAVAGVVNFVLDTEYTGLKGQINYGITELGDGGVISGDLAYGTAFGGGRGHILLSGNYAKSDRIKMSEGLRDWYQPGFRTINNPAWTATNGQVGQLVRNDVGFTSTQGGVIVGGPLAGIDFQPGGAVGQFVFGPPSLTVGAIQAGGTVEPASIRAALLPELEYWSVFGRASYELSENVTALIEGSYAGNDTTNWSAIYNRQGGGATSALTIQRDNPFIPVVVQQAMDNAPGGPVTSFRMNRLFNDLVNRPGENIGEAGYNRRQNRITVALEGKFADSGRWRAYAQRGRSQVTYTRDNNVIVSRFNQAVNVTSNPAVGGVPGVAIGAPVCRSTLTAPTNGCVPMNVFGEGSPSAQSIAYVTGENDGLRTRQDLDIGLDVYAIDAQYSPFSTWAGPVSIAAGFEYREEFFTATSDVTSQARSWFVGNFQPGGAGYNVKEAFGEVLVPLLKDSAVGDLELNGAVRRTDYSTSGAVTTWKLGTAYRFGDLRLRATRSRDIRAPNLNDLFAPQSQFVNQFEDRSLPNSPQVAFVTLNGGNPLLTPEIADTWTVGGAYQPSWAPGLTATVDWYKINIRDAIFGVGGQLLLDLCYGFNRPSTPSACQSIIPAAGSVGLTGATLLTGGINAQDVEVEGIDYELSYRTQLSDISTKLPGALTLRVLASQRITDQTNLPGDTTPPDLGTAGSLKWRGFGSATYAVGPSRTTVTGRYLGPGVVNNLAQTSRNGLPVDANRLPAVWYWELSQNVDVKIGDSTVTLFAVVENLFDKDPPPFPTSAISFGASPVYDLLGRSYRFGLRFKM